MPFTPSHAVIALPFLRTPLVPAAIAVGAMTPDAPLFVRVLPLSYALTHSPAWLPATIALALVLLLVWRCALRPAARELAPDFLARRLPGEWDAGAGRALRESFGGGSSGGEPVRWRGVLVLVTSLAIGVLSHILWDLFTHEGRWGVQLVPALDEQWGPLTGYKWLQHGSSAVGLAIIGVWAVVWLRRRTRGAGPRRVLPRAVRIGWIASLPAVLGAAWLIGLAVYGPITAEWTVPHLAYRVLPPACALWGAATLGLAILVQVLRARGDRPAQVSAPTPRRPGPIDAAPRSGQERPDKTAPGQRS